MSLPSVPSPAALFSRDSWPERKRIAELLRAETVGGALLLVAALVALIWANSPWRESYAAVREFELGTDVAHLRLSLSHWAADGLLAIFFFVAGLELKYEFVAGSLREVRRAAVPVVAAVAGVALPAVLYLAIVRGDSGASRGWAIPTATDIAFALAVLAVVGSQLPSALRAFLLSLAVVDDLIAITIIAVFYTEHLSPGYLLAAVLPLAAFAVATQRRITAWWVLLPLAVATWVLVHASGIHATVAGVLLGLVVPVRRRDGERHSVAHRLEHRIRPISAGVAVPAFALMAAGVTLVGGGLSEAFGDRVLPAIVASLVIGKLVGVFAGAYLTARLTKATLDESLQWWDIAGVSLLAGIGFTVSLLVGELAFGAGSDRDDHIKAAVLLGSLLAAVAAAVVLRVRNSRYEAMWAAEQAEPEEADDANAAAAP